jgi:HEAT repeat protein
MSDSSLQRILRDLQSDQPDVEGVIDRLVEAAAAQPDAVVSFLLAIANPGPALRAVIVRVLGGLVPAGAAGVPVLVRILRDATEEEDTRVEAAASLGQFGAIAIETLVGLCQDPDAFVRDHAANELGNIGISTDLVLDTLAGALADPVESVRDSGIRSLSRCRDGSVVSALTRSLSQANRATRIGAARALLALDPRNQAALQAAISGLDNESATVRALACDTVAIAKQKAKPAVSALCRKLVDENPEVRSRAAHALQELREAARDAVPALGKALHDPCSDVRDWAGLALLRFGADAREAAADLIGALQVRVQKSFDPEDAERFFLVYLMRSVGNLGPLARGALPALEEARRIVADVAEQQELVSWAIRRCQGSAGG